MGYLRKNPVRCTGFSLMKLDFVSFCGGGAYLLVHHPWCQSTARCSPRPFPFAPGRRLVGEEAALFQEAERNAELLVAEEERLKKKAEKRRMKKKVSLLR